jgi:uncharacterized protein (TIGR02328 family)
MTRCDIVRLWHEDLISRLPRQQLLGQHRECCALRGKGWGKRHATVNYVFDYSPYKLYQYHQLVMDEMVRRGYRPTDLWRNPLYRGIKCAPYKSLDVETLSKPIYIEHNQNYLTECLDNLKSKNIEI